MNLRRKTLLSVSAMLAVMIVALVLLSYGIVTGAAMQTEREHVAIDLDRVSGSIDLIGSEIGRTTADWAVWNDTYEFMNDRNQEYVDTNLGYETYSGLRLNCLLFFDSSCQLVYGSGYDYVAEMPWALSDDLLGAVRANVNCLGFERPGDSAQGLVRTDAGILMICVHPVADNDLTVTNGFLVMGRYIDDEIAREISSTIKLDTVLLPVDQRPHAGPNAASWNDVVLNGTTLTVPLDGTTINGYRALTGINGSAVGVIKIQAYRDVYVNANASMSIIHGMLIVVSVVFCSATILITDRFTTRRLDRLSRQLKDIGKDGDMSRKIVMDGSDELAHLADELNKAMGTTLAMSEALSDSERRYHAIVNDQTEAIFRLDESGKIRFANDAFIKLLGTGSQELDGRSLRELMTEEQYQDIADMCDAARPAASAVTAGHRFRVADEHDRWISWTVRRVPSPERAVEYQFVGRDLTEQKEAEMALASANNKLSLLASVTRHDVINKLTVAHGFVSIARSKVADQKCAENLARAEEALEVIEGYLEFTRNYQSMGLVAPVWIDLERAMAKAAAAPRAEGIDVNVDVAGLEMLADPLVEKVFLNLVDNSMRHGGKVTTIAVTARAVDRGLVLTFEDDGVGIPEHEKELIFQAGYGKHTGYGLFLAREILVASGMSIVETGREGSGARFEIAVPSGRFRHAATAG